MRMARKAPTYATLAVAGVLGVIAACSADQTTVSPRLTSGPTRLADASSDHDRFDFTGLTASAVCTVSGGDAVKPLVLADGFDQRIIASEPDFDDAIDMNTQNETGPHRGRYLYRPSEGSRSTVAVTDLLTGETHRIAGRADWESLDPIVWTPWGSLLIAEETNGAAKRDPDFPDAVAGLVYELVLDQNDPSTVTQIIARPAIGSKSHEGMRFDKEGNLYSISERTPGYIFKFVPDNKGDLSSGQSYVLKVTQPNGDRVGGAEWVAIDRAKTQIDASLEGDRVQGTGYGRPEDLEISTSSGNDATTNGHQTLYAAITSEHRVIAIDLDADKAGGSTEAFVYNYVARGVNVDNEFEMPDNLALDRDGNLYIDEDPGGSFGSGKRKGDDIWVAQPNVGYGPSLLVKRLASLNDCDAEPTGSYVALDGKSMFVNIQHRGGDRLDKAVEIFLKKE
jgi:uncharacterized protein